MDHATLCILMLFVGLALVMAEFFIPSGGLIAILAVICLSISVWGAYSAWWDSSPNLWWSYVALFIVLIPVSIGGSFVLMQHTSLGRHVLLDAPSLEEVTPYTEEEAKLRQMIGKRGKTISLLNPGGMVSVDGERFHCECPGLLIESGENVMVTGLKGNRLVVRPDTDADLNAADSEFAANGPDEIEDETDSSPLDFDIPQS